MAYRLHITVYDGDQRLSAEHIKHDLVGLFKEHRIGVTGTRYGVPGLWVERSSKSDLRYVVWLILRFSQNTGYVFHYAATNEPTAAAIRDLVPVERG